MKTSTQNFLHDDTLSNKVNDRAPVYSHRNQSGLTLVELMIALTLSLLLMAGILQVFMGNKKTYKVQDAMARVQENGRFALHFLSKDVRMAGFMGCQNLGGGLSVYNNIDTTASGWSDPSAVAAAVGSFTGNNAVQGYSYSTGTAPSSLSALGITSGTSEGNIWPNTDALFIRRAYTCPGGDVGSDSGTSASLTIADNSTCNIQQNDIVMVTNCRTADIFGVSNVVNSSGAATFDTIAHGANWNLAPQLNGGYGADSFLLRMQAEVYYIGVGTSGEPALFKRELRLGSMSSSELVEGIEGLSILYGEDLDGDENPDTYVTEGSVTNFDNVISLRITVTARTLVDNVATSVSASGDRRIRRTFTTTIGIRNRMS